MGGRLETTPDLHAEALARAGGGWAVIPVRNDAKGHKRAACKWERFQNNRPTPEELARLFHQHGLTGLAVILGPISGDLYARDFDVPEAYQRWVAACPDLGRTLPTYQTGRGYQVLAYHPDVRTRDLGDGELRGAGVYSVLPPSLHPSGRRYVWTVGGPERRIEIAPEAAGLARPWCPDTSPPEQRDRGPGNRETEESENQRVRESEEVGERPHPGDSNGNVTLPELIRRAIPQNEHENYRTLFLLARGMKALALARGREWTMREIEALAFTPWYEQNRHLRPEQTRAEYLSEFLRGYDLVRHPLGDGVLDATWAKSATIEPPPIARQFVSPEMQRVVTWCSLLQAVAGAEPFYLSVRLLQGKLRLGSPRAASAILRRLVEVGILAEVEKGGRQTNRATRFRYLAVA